MLIFNFLLIVNLVAALYIWFDTDALPEWASLLKLKFLKYKEYADNKKSFSPLVSSQEYVEFLAAKYGENSFFIRLISCPVCFSVWLNIALVCLFYNKIGVMILGPNIILTWVLYHSLRWVLQKLNAQ